MSFSVRLSISVLLLFLPFAASNAMAQKQDVSALRSAYLFYFSHFIEWPTVYVFENKKFNLCVLSTQPSDLFQLSTLEGKATGSNVLHIVDVETVEKNKAVGGLRCHMLYLGGNATKPKDKNYLLDYTLIITEGEDDSGDIHLYSQESKLKFEINKAVLDSKNFNVSSKLMRLSQRAK